MGYGVVAAVLADVGGAAFELAAYEARDPAVAHVRRHVFALELPVVSLVPILYRGLLDLLDGDVAAVQGGAHTLVLFAVDELDEVRAERLVERPVGGPGLLVDVAEYGVEVAGLGPGVAGDEVGDALRLEPVDGARRPARVGRPR
jgi:hypothetical protein